MDSHEWLESAPEYSEYTTDEVPSGVEYLSNNDYTLNSPLTPDSTIAFKCYLETNHLDPRLAREWWPRIAPKFRQFGTNKDVPLPPDQNHTIWTEITNTTQEDYTEIETLLNQTNHDVIETYPVLEAFLKGWIGREDLAPTKIINNPTILKYGQLFFSAHRLTLLLNCKSEKELDSLKTWGKIRGNFLDGPSTVCRSVVPLLGEVIVGGGFVWLIKWRMLIDRNFLLMMKDTWLARFNSLLSLSGRTDNKYPIHTIPWLIRWYSSGDDLLEVEGNAGFTAIRLLESLCLERLSLVAGRSRPLIPQFTSFSKHLDDTIRNAPIGRHHLTTWRAWLTEINDFPTILTIYGSFRHWGHPYIDYLAGLRKLYNQVTMRKNIDESYSQSLASDLAKLILTKKFKETKTWCVHVEQVDSDHSLSKHIKEGTWPTGGEIASLGSIWHTLPLKKCFDVPDLLDPSVVYSDKSHSLTRREVIEHVKKFPEKPIPSKKVLKTLLETEATDWGKFLAEVNRNGISRNDSVIGLKGKERELKVDGRFYALMSWELRDYFVITEYLIKTYYVPLFSGLTMADDITELTKKMLDSTSGQGLLDYSRVCIANHIDYEKWNNHQRSESTSPIFKVMDQFLGFEKVISRTHEVFETSLFYYNDRPDLMCIKDDTLESLPGHIVAWNGQAGGLEGLRQKGWTAIGLLAIQREGKVRNTAIKTLAQGDNQVVCTQYKIPFTKNTDELRICLQNIITNNEVIMSAIRLGAQKLGLIINQDETMQSAEMLVYGKIPVIYGNIMSLEIKRYSRVSCVTNDQIPSLANVISTVNTACLTVSHNSDSPIESMRQHLYFGNLVRVIIELHDPVLQDAIEKVIPVIRKKPTIYAMSTLYLDPSLGGMCGMSLTRFLIRAFPDPITEGLSFWKLVGSHTNNGEVINLALKAGNPELAPLYSDQLDKLLEDPLSLNLKRTISVLYLLKQEIKKHLVENVQNIKNTMIRTSIEYTIENEQPLRNYLLSVDPLFPRFLSEFKSATYLGIVEAITGLIQNSITIRNLFRRKMSKRVDEVMYTSERKSIAGLVDYPVLLTDRHLIWSCSSFQADKLRERSWGRPVIGATIPHPLEILGKSHICSDCPGCDDVTSREDYLTTSLPHGLRDFSHSRGPLKVYLGSRTMESTSTVSPWEKEVKVPLLRRAGHLRSAIHWFVTPGTNVAISILSILEGLTGEKWEDCNENFKRTGSALHRFSCSRQSAGGYCAISPTKLSRMITTTDTLSTLGDENYDFMFQSLILYAQVSIGELHNNHPQSAVYHSHIVCRECIRRIQEPLLTSPLIYFHPDLSDILKRWIPPTAKLYETIPTIHLPVGEWEKLKPGNAAFQIGRSLGFAYGDSVYSVNTGYESGSLFAISVRSATRMEDFFLGLLDGIMRSASVNILHRRHSSNREELARIFRGATMHIISDLSKDAPAINLFRSEECVQIMSRVNHRVPASYPLRQQDLGLLLRGYMEELFAGRSFNYGDRYISKYQETWIFAEFYISRMAGLLLVSTACLRFVTSPRRTSHKDKINLLKLKGQVERLSGGNDLTLEVSTKDARLCNHEVRSACKIFSKAFKLNRGKPDKVWNEIPDGTITEVLVETRCPGDGDERPTGWNPPQHGSPLISGLRTAQLATGSHYKARAILSNSGVRYRDALCGGDGSGGITAFLLRWNPNSRAIFNSLLSYDECDLRGAKPSPPSALGMHSDLRRRCINYSTAWENPSDLSSQSTWDYFLDLRQSFDLNIDLLFLDMEVSQTQTMIDIEDCVVKNVPHLLSSNGNVIFKTYLTYLSTHETNILTKLSYLFTHVLCIQTSYSGMYTSEIYILFRSLKSEADGRTSINWNKFVNDTSQCYCWLDSQTEFQRAQLLDDRVMIQSIPPELIPAIWPEFTRIWESIGIPIGVAGDLAYNLEVIRKTDHPNYLLAVMIIALNFHIPTTANHLTPPSPPSDLDMERVASLACATLMWLGWSTGNRMYYTQGETMFNQGAPVYIKRETVKVKLTKLGDRVERHKLRWDIIPGGANKTVRLQRKSALIGSIIRLYARYSRSTDTEFINSKGIYLFTSSVNSGLVMKHVLSKTGVADWMSNSNLGAGVGPRFENSKGWNIEECWRD